MLRVLVPPVLVLKEMKADVVVVFAAKESKMGLILLAAVRNIQLTMVRPVPAGVFGSTALIYCGSVLSAVK